jgi:hypothetical protein
LSVIVSVSQCLVIAQFRQVAVVTVLGLAAYRRHAVTAVNPPGKIQLAALAAEGNPQAGGLRRNNTGARRHSVH